MRVNLPPEVIQDLRELESEALQREPFRFLGLLKSQPRLGRPLGDRPGTGDLSGCRKVYFDKGPDRAPGYRIVYRLLPDEDRAEIVDVIVIGAKPGPDPSVYLEALERLRGA